MTKEEIKQSYPDAYSEILQEGILQELKEAESRIENELATKEAFNFKL